MKKKREYNPAGVKATITLQFWFPGVHTCNSARDIICRTLKIQPREGDWFIQLGGTSESYRVIEEAQAQKMNLPKHPKDEAESAQ